MAKRTPSAAFMKPVTPDEALAEVVGDTPIPRTELTKKLWDYIRKNGLQDANKKTLINAPASKVVLAFVGLRISQPCPGPMSVWTSSAPSWATRSRSRNRSGGRPRLAARGGFFRCGHAPDAAAGT
jgi:hypothetical protein